ncbi:MAG TPA: alpha/beta hydrolase [Vicinamibacterales bacterium]|nr:alpha/beta hydrolase [Vicinamibacterales bacterium]
MTDLLRSDLFRFLTGALLLGVAALTRIAAPTEFLWKVSIAATEGGHWLALAALVPAIPRGGHRIIGKIGGVCGVVAAALFLVPLYQAHQISADLPAQIESTFGKERRERGRFSEDARIEPLNFADMLGSVASRPVRLEERTFNTTDGEKLTLDVLRPGYEHGPLPGVLVVHGGSWQSGNSREFLALNGYLAARDFLVFSINYRLAPKWKFPAGRDDVLSALAYIKVYARELGLDATRLALMGRSGGAQLALLAAYTANEPAIRGVVSVYGPTDLTYGYAHPASRQLIDTRAVLEAYLGGPPAKADEAYFAASPINFVSPASPATLLIHGLHDGHVSPEESARLEAKLQESTVKHLFVRLPWATHGCDWTFNGPCGQITTYAIEHFLERVMRVAPAAPKNQPTRLAMKTKQRGAD